MISNSKYDCTVTNTQNRQLAYRQKQNNNYTFTNADNLRMYVCSKTLNQGCYLIRFLIFWLQGNMPVWKVNFKCHQLILRPSGQTWTQCNVVEVYSEMWCMLKPLIIYCTCTEHVCYGIHRPPQYPLHFPLFWLSTISLHWWIPCFAGLILEPFRIRPQCLAPLDRTLFPL